MKIHYLQHVPFETPAKILDWARDRGHEVSATHLYKGEPLPGLDGFDMLVVMGGPMGVHDEEQYPWLAREKEFLAQANEAGKRILGICLGAQLLALVLGGEVRRNPVKELGWHKVVFTPLAWNSPLFGKLPGTMMAFHWHGDTFSIPRGAHHIASSDGCINQAFCLDNRVVGLQFHMESTPESIKALVENCGDELNEEGEFIQDRETILNGMDQCEAMHRELYRLLDAMAS